MNAIQTVEAADLKQKLPQLTPGDTVRVHVKVRETSVKEEIKGKPKETVRERVQVFEGVVIALRGSGTRASVTVRKVWVALSSAYPRAGVFEQVYAKLQGAPPD